MQDSAAGHFPQNNQINLVWRRGRRLLQLLRLYLLRLNWLHLLLLHQQLLLALLQFLLNLLGRSGALRRKTSRRVNLGRWWRLRVDLVVVGIVVVIVLRRTSIRLRRPAAGLASAEDEFTWCSRSLVPDHDDVVTRALQKLGEHIPRPSRPEASKYSLILVESLHPCAGSGRDVIQNLLQT
jgi:hypothetical protein